MSPNPLRNVSSDELAFLGLREVPACARDSKVFSIISPKTPEKRVTTSPVPQSSAATNTLLAKTVHLSRSRRSSTPTRGASHSATRANWDRL